MDKDENGDTIFVGNRTGKRRPVIERKPGEPSMMASKNCTSSRPSSTASRTTCLLTRKKKDAAE
jgi:hypothetical protein